MSMKKNVVESETGMFWRICQDLKSDDPQLVTEAIDELEVLQSYTDSESLKAKCAHMLTVIADRAVGVKREARA